MYASRQCRRFNFYLKSYDKLASRPGRRGERPGEYCSLIALLAESALPEKPGNLDTVSILPSIC